MINKNYFKQSRGQFWNKLVKQAHGYKCIFDLMTAIYLKGVHLAMISAMQYLQTSFSLQRLVTF